MPAISRSRRWRDLVPALALLFASATGTVLVGLGSPPARQQYAVVVPPWYTYPQAAALIGAAGGEIVGLGGLSAVLIAHSNSPGFARSLYDAGAWLVLDPLGVSGCLIFKSGTVSGPGPA